MPSSHEAEQTDEPAEPDPPAHSRSPLASVLNTVIVGMMISVLPSAG